MLAWKQSCSIPMENYWVEMLAPTLPWIKWIPEESEELFSNIESSNKAIKDFRQSSVGNFFWVYWCGSHFILSKDLIYVIKTIVILEKLWIVRLMLRRQRLTCVKFFSVILDLQERCNGSIEFLLSTSLFLPVEILHGTFGKNNTVTWHVIN